MLLVPARFMFPYGLFPFIIMMDIAAQKDISFVFPYSCIIPVYCLPVIPTRKTSLHRFAQLKHLLMGLYEVFKKRFPRINHTVIVLNAVWSWCQTFLWHKQSGKETSWGATVVLWSQRHLKMHKCNKGHVLTPVLETWLHRLCLPAALLC